MVENKKLVDEKENLLKLLDHEKRLKEGVLNTVEKHADIENELNHLKKENHDLAQENDHLNNQNDFNKGLVSQSLADIPFLCDAFELQQFTLDKAQMKTHISNDSRCSSSYSESDWWRG